MLIAKFSRLKRCFSLTSIFLTISVSHMCVGIQTFQALLPCLSFRCNNSESFFYKVAKFMHIELNLIEYWLWILSGESLSKACHAKYGHDLEHGLPFVSPSWTSLTNAFKCKRISISTTHHLFSDSFTHLWWCDQIRMASKRGSDSNWRLHERAGKGNLCFATNLTF